MVNPPKADFIDESERNRNPELHCANSMEVRFQAQDQKSSHLGIRPKRFNARLGLCTFYSRRLRAPQRRFPVAVGPPYEGGFLHAPRVLRPYTSAAQKQKPGSGGERTETRAGCSELGANGGAGVRRSGLGQKLPGSGSTRPHKGRRLGRRSSRYGTAISIATLYFFCASRM